MKGRNNEGGHDTQASQGVSQLHFLFNLTRDEAKISYLSIAWT